MIFRDATFPDLSGIPDFPGSEGPVRVNHPDLVLFFLVVMGRGATEHLVLVFNVLKTGAFFMF